MDQPNLCSIAKILNPVLKTNIPIDLWEGQWREMPIVMFWNDCFGEVSGQSLNVFRSNVHSYKDSSSSKPFKKFADLVLNILCVPTSNACVERIFSIINLTNTKWNAIWIIRSF